MTQTTDTAVNELETESIGKLLARFSLPAIVSMTVVSLYNIISSIFIGQSEGPMAITGLTITFPLINLVLAVCLMVGIGGATMCSIELGAKHRERAAKTLGSTVVLSVVFAFAFAVPCLVFIDPILRIFGASDATLPYARDYMEIILLFSPVGNTMIALMHFMRASGYPLRAMAANLFSVAVNVVFTPLFIFGFGWGIKGAAYATVLAQGVTLTAMMLHYCNKNSSVHFKRGIWRVRLGIAGPQLAVGLAPCLMNASACLVIVAINLSLRHYGGDLSIGAYGIANRLLMLFAMIIFGLNQGMQPLIGYNYGARRMDRVRLTLRYGVMAGAAITSVGFFAFQFTPEPLVRLFTTHPELIEKAVQGLRLSTVVFFLVGAQIVIAGYFQSMGRASVAIFLSLSRQLIFLIPAMIVLPFFIGITGVWLSLPFADVMAFLVTIAFFWRARTSKVKPPVLE